MVDITNPGMNVQTWPIANMNGLRLFPGINKVEEEIARELLKHPLLKQMLDKGLLHIESGFLDLVNKEKEKLEKNKADASADKADKKDSAKDK